MRSNIVELSLLLNQHEVTPGATPNLARLFLKLTWLLS